MSEEKRLAVLIDSDNVSAKHAQYIMQEVVKYGVPTYKRVYGDWEKGGNGWHNPAINYSIMPVQQTSYIAGKNATDFSMIIDAMDILYTGKVDGFVLVTSDSDFTRLAIRLREAGMLVVGIGELKTPRAFTASCNHFCYLNQVCAPDEGMADEKVIRKAVLDFVTENKDERLVLAKISDVLTSRFGNINYDEMGYKRFSNFIDSFPELRRSNTFVSLKKKREEKPAPAPLPAGAPTEQEIVAAIGEFFKTNPPVRDNMMKLESYLTGIFGIIDYSRFGSKRFAKFIDKLDDYTRNGTDIAPVSAAETASEKPEAKPVKPQTNPVTEKPASENKPAAEEKPLTVVVKPAETAEPANPTEQPSMSGVSALVFAYAGDNMPDGGNLGQLNNELMARFGKTYLADLGFEDIKSMLAQIKDIRVRRNHVFLTDAKYAEYVDNALKAAEKKQEPAPEEKLTEAVVPQKQKRADRKEVPADTPEIPAVTEQPAEPVQAEAAPEKEAPPAETEKRRRGRKKVKAEETDKAEVAEQSEQTEQPVEAPAETTVPEINAVKRDILMYASSDEDGKLSKLGNLLAEKYGKGWLKAVGFSSVKKLLSGMKAVTVDGDRVVINEEFAKQTEEIEQFVNNYARSEGSRSVRALSSQLKKNFEGFDISDFGFTKFSDFVNAIDGVRAERYHVVPSDENT